MPTYLNSVILSFIMCWSRDKNTYFPFSKDKNLWGNAWEETWNVVSNLKVHLFSPFSSLDQIERSIKVKVTQAILSAYINRPGSLRIAGSTKSETQAIKLENKNKKFMEAPKPRAHMLCRTLKDGLWDQLRDLPPTWSFQSQSAFRLEWLLVEFLSQTDWVFNKPQLAFGHDPWYDHSNFQQLCPQVPTMLDLHILHRTLHPHWTPGSHHSKQNTLLEVPQAESTNLYLCFKLSFSAEEEGLVLCICRCSSIGIKARGFQAILQPPYRKPPKIPSRKGSHA